MLPESSRLAQLLNTETPGIEQSGNPFFADQVQRQIDAGQVYSDEPAILEINVGRVAVGTHVEFQLAA